MVKNREINKTEDIGLGTFIPGPYFLLVAKANERTYYMRALQWRHNEHDGVSYHQPQDRLLNRLFKA